MKLWFEGWNVNVHDGIAVPVRAGPATSTAAIRARNSLAVIGRRGDSAAKDFETQR
jgi:hypothetical protein